MVMGALAERIRISKNIKRRIMHQRNQDFLDALLNQFEEYDRQPWYKKIFTPHPIWDRVYKDPTVL